MWVSADRDGDKVFKLTSEYKSLLFVLFSVLLTWIFSSPFYEYLYYRYYHYDMDDRNVIIRKGIISKREITLPLSKITDVYVDQDVTDVVMGLYDIHISTPTQESGKFAHIDGLNKKGATEIKKLVLDKVHQYSNLGKKDEAKSSAPASEEIIKDPPKVSPIEEIKE